jgi:hypothetical protein
MKITFITIILSLSLLTACIGAVDVKDGGLIPLQSLDLKALADHLAVYKHEDDATIQYALGRALNGTVLQNAIFATEFSKPPSLGSSAAGITCSTTITSPPSWKMIYVALLLYGRPGVCLPGPGECTVLYELLGVKIEYCSSPNKPLYRYAINQLLQQRRGTDIVVSCKELAVRSIEVSNKCIMWFGAQHYLTSGQDIFGSNHKDRIPAMILNNMV